MKRQIEIEDTLQERVESAQDDLQQMLIEYLNDNPDSEDVPCLFNDIDYDGRFHELVDSSVPIYTSEIEDTWYLYANDLEQAYKNAGIGDNPREGDGMVAIYFYIQEQLANWYDENAEDTFNEWQCKNMCIHYESETCINCACNSLFETKDL